MRKRRHEIRQNRVHDAVSHVNRMMRKMRGLHWNHTMRKTEALHKLEHSLKIRKNHKIRGSCEPPQYQQPEQETDTGKHPEPAFSLPTSDLPNGDT